MKLFSLSHQFHTLFALTVLLSGMSFSLRAAEPLVQVELDVTAVPELQEWGKNAQRQIEEWYPRMTNLLSSQDFVPPGEVTLKFIKSDEGIAATTRNRIVVSSHWIEKHPDDIGLVIHEMVHVIQSYPNGNPGWITEGIADYMRWAIYEGKPQSWFPVGNPQRGYRGSYRIAAGFLLWLETAPAPGIVRKLNTAMRTGTYTEAIFEQETGHTLDELWAEYVQTRKKN